MKWKRIVVPIYSVEVFFCIEKDSSKVASKIKRLGFRVREKDTGDIDGSANAGCVIPLLDEDGLKSYLLWLPDFANNPEHMNTVTHGLTHIKSYTFQHIGITMGLPEKYDELEAYLMGYLAGEFFKFTRRK